MPQVAIREKELKAITNHLLSTSATSIEGRLHEIRRFVDREISDLRTLLNGDTALAKAELQKHLGEIRMTPTKGREERHYVAEGTLDLLGTGPNAPVLELAHSVGCGGPHRTADSAHTVYGQSCSRVGGLTERD